MSQLVTIHGVTLALPHLVRHHHTCLFLIITSPLSSPVLSCRSLMWSVAPPICLYLHILSHHIPPPAPHSFVSHPQPNLAPSLSLIVLLNWSCLVNKGLLLIGDCPWAEASGSRGGSSVPPSGFSYEWQPPLHTALTLASLSLVLIQGPPNLAPKLPESPVLGVSLHKVP